MGEVGEEVFDLVASRCVHKHCHSCANATHFGKGTRVVWMSEQLAWRIAVRGDE